MEWVCEILNHIGSKFCVHDNLVAEILQFLRSTLWLNDNLNSMTIQHIKDFIIIIGFSYAHTIHLVPGQCTNGAVRLVGGYTPMEGRVEVCANGIWKMVCHDNWNQPDGNVVCRELGYGEYGNRVRYASFYGHSDNGFLFGNVRCSGNEERLVDCTVNANSQCSVLSSAGVQCSNRSK